MIKSNECILKFLEMQNKNVLFAILQIRHGIKAKNPNKGIKLCLEMWNL